MIPNLTPNNLLEEKEKFFSDQNYEPQFDYEDFIESSYLVRYGHTKEKYTQLAKQIVEVSYKGKTEEELLEEKGVVLPEHEVEEKINLFLKMHGLENRFKITWSSSFVARTAITKDTIRLRLPTSLRKGNLLGTIYHEIGTHAIRRINYEQQPWYRRKRKYGFSNYLRTEEGLAVLHALIPQENKMAYSAALRYLTVDFAQSHSFAETYKFLNTYVSDSERCWLATLRTKKGVYDTSSHETNTKNLVYFEGLVDILQYLKEHNFDITYLYYGKMAKEDVEKAVAMNPDFEPLLPSFFVTDKDSYKKSVLEIGLINKLID